MAQATQKETAEEKKKREFHEAENNKWYDDLKKRIKTVPISELKRLEETLNESFKDRATQYGYPQYERETPVNFVSEIEKSIAKSKVDRLYEQGLKIEDADLKNYPFSPDIVVDDEGKLKFPEGTSKRDQFLAQEAFSRKAQTFPEDRSQPKAPPALNKETAKEEVGNKSKPVEEMTDQEVLRQAKRLLPEHVFQPAEAREILKILQDDPNQKKLFQDIRVDSKGNIRVPEKLNPRLEDLAENIQQGTLKIVGSNAFPSVGQTWQQYQETPAGKTAFESLGSTFLGTDATVSKENLFSAPQRRLQGNLIDLLSKNLGSLTEQPNLPKPPPIGTLPAAPQLNYNLPGYQNPQAQPPGYGKLENLFRSGEGFSPIEDQARRQFTTKTIPSLAERFTALGGGQRSSAFPGALGSAASELESNLASLRAQYGERARQQGFQELSTQNQQQLALQQLMNQLAQGQNAQQLQREELQNQLGLGTNTQKLAEQSQAAQQSLALKGLQQQQFGAQSTQGLEANRQSLSALLGLLQPALQSQTVPVVNPGSPGILQSAAQATAQAAPYLAASLL